MESDLHSQHERDATFVSVSSDHFVGFGGQRFSSLDEDLLFLWTPRVAQSRKLLAILRSKSLGL